MLHQWGQDHAGCTNSPGPSYLFWAVIQSDLGISPHVGTRWARINGVPAGVVRSCPLLGHCENSALFSFSPTPSY